MGKVILGALLLPCLLTETVYAAEEYCVPQVKNNMVMLELFDAGGQAIYSQQRAVSPVVFYKDVVWTRKHRV